ncbi:MAG: hypothetical protein CMK28_00130 [Porticoccaceae bacterium]|mgnify:FL=1|nr:hypothetical protein [Porticoccaceae bacterium]
MNTHTIEPAYHPRSKMTFLIDWLVTLKCNYDCAYCGIGPSGHDNSKPHPDYDKCVKMVSQMYAYCDLVLAKKKLVFKDAIMNIYGGESIHHPDIVKLIKKTSELYQPYKNNWRLKRRMTTNGTATEKKWEVLCQHVEGFTMSYHSTGPTKLKNMFKRNLKYLNSIGKEHDVIVCMYPSKDYWKDCVSFLHWAKKQGINARPKMLDGPLGVYKKEHLKDLEDFIDSKELAHWDVSVTAEVQGRGCCGGRRMCFDRNIKQHQFIVPRGPNGFLGWHCSANQFFLHGNTSTGLYYTNKDCKVRLDGKTGPIANLHTMGDYIKSLAEKPQLPTLICAQKTCTCGTCAPKSIHKENLTEILKIYNDPSLVGNV